MSERPKLDRLSLRAKGCTKGYARTRARISTKGVVNMAQTLAHARCTCLKAMMVTNGLCLKIAHIGGTCVGSLVHGKHARERLKCTC